MAITQLLDFLKEAVKYAKVDPAAMGADPESLQDIASHKRVVRLSGAFGVLGLVVGIFSWVPELVAEAKGDMAGSRFQAYLIAPLMGTIAGILFGVSVACLFAPAWFFQSPLGNRLLILVGTKNVTIARGASLVMGLLTGGLLGGVWIKALF